MDETAEAGPRKGMSTGLKVLLGCLGLVVVAFIGLAAVVTVGGIALRDEIEAVVGSAEDQIEATETLQRLAEEHPFEPPEDGVVPEASLERYLAITEEARADIEPWAEQLRDLERSAGEGIGRLREMASGAQALGGMVRSRVELAEALDAHDTSLGEFLWTGLALQRAAEALDGDRSVEGIPEANRSLVEARSAEIPRLGDDDAGIVLTVAVMWGMGDMTTWRAMGLDTLTSR